jgi:hypothetical protein
LEKTICSDPEGRMRERERETRRERGKERERERVRDITTSLLCSFYVPPLPSNKLCCQHIGPAAHLPIFPGNTLPDTHKRNELAIL